LDKNTCGFFIATGGSGLFFRKGFFLINLFKKGISLENSMNLLKNTLRNDFVIKGTSGLFSI
jgi:hypothetical protein